jgi:hypothetical protein
MFARKGSTLKNCMPDFVGPSVCVVPVRFKEIRAPPGNHLIEVRDASGRDVFGNTVRVIDGRTVEIRC